jgi:predicted Zn-ribbon and HTH transcriptional regulator
MIQLTEKIDERARQADKIVKNPAQYKICEGCDSIVLQKAATCPNCASYRFEESIELIVKQARILGMRQRSTVLATDLQ